MIISMADLYNIKIYPTYTYVYIYNVIDIKLSRYLNLYNSARQYFKNLAVTNALSGSTKVSEIICDLMILFVYSRLWLL